MKKKTSKELSKKKISKETTGILLKVRSFEQEATNKEGQTVVLNKAAVILKVEDSLETVFCFSEDIAGFKRGDEITVVYVKSEDGKYDNVEAIY